jgi:hypothetical protein
VSANWRAVRRTRRLFADGCRAHLDRALRPYFSDRANFPIHELRPEASCRFVYPPHVDLEKVAYFFDSTMDRTVPEEVHQPTGRWVQEWQRRWSSGEPDTLVFRRLQDIMFINDYLWPEPGMMHTLRRAWAMAYEYCRETMRIVPQILDHLERIGAGAIPDWGDPVGEELVIRVARQNWCKQHRNRRLVPARGNL